jgi:hypothetical protein
MHPECATAKPPPTKTSPWPAIAAVFLFFGIFGGIVCVGAIAKQAEPKHVAMGKQLPSDPGFRVGQQVWFWRADFLSWRPPVCPTDEGIIAYQRARRTDGDFEARVLPSCFTVKPNTRGVIVTPNHPARIKIVDGTHANKEGYTDTDWIHLSPPE